MKGKRCTLAQCEPLLKRSPMNFASKAKQAVGINNTWPKVQGCTCSLVLNTTGADMRTLLLGAIGLALIIELLYLSLVGLSSTLAKYDYCYDTVMAAKYAKYAEYDLPKPDFTEYGLKSEPECKQ